MTKRDDGGRQRRRPGRAGPAAAAGSGGSAGGQRFAGLSRPPRAPPRAGRGPWPSPPRSAPARRPYRVAPLPSNRDLRTDLDRAPARDSEILARVVGGSSEPDEQPLLPARHLGFGREPQGSSGEEERGAHHVEGHALGTGSNERAARSAPP